MSSQCMVFEYERRTTRDPSVTITSHYCSVIVEQPPANEANYYRTKHLHLHKHGQISTNCVGAYKRSLEIRGFKQLSDEHANNNGRRPLKYFYVCLAKKTTGHTRSLFSMVFNIMNILMVLLIEHPLRRWL